MLELELVARLVMAFILGGLIGLEREVHGRPAGLRTHILVGFGSALIMVVSIYGFSGITTNYDPGRIAAQVVSGIGFLGAGTILREGLSIKGLTTAASLWMVAAIGLAVGSGMLLIATLSTFVVLLVLTILHGVENKFEAGGQAYDLEVDFYEPGQKMPEIISLAREYRGKVSFLEVQPGKSRLRLSLRIPNQQSSTEVLQKIIELNKGVPEE